MWLKSHQWVDIPGTRTERRRVLNVKESKHTAMLLNKKYFDIDTGKWIRDKLEKINVSSLADIIDDSIHNNMSYGERPQNRYTGYLEEQKEPDNVYNFPKFVPKDDDFEEEDRLAKEAALQAVVEEKERLKRILNPHVFQAVLAEAEARAVKMNEPIAPSEPNRDRSFAYVIKNKWSGPR